MTLGKNFSITLTIAAILAVLIRACFVFSGLGFSSNISIINSNTFSQALLINALKNNFIINAEDQNQTFEVSSEILKSWVDFRFRNYTDQQEYIIDKEKIKRYLIGLPVNLAIQPVNGQLGLDENNQIFERVPSKNGKILNPEKSSADIILALNNGRNWTQLVFDDTTPKVSSQKAMELGVNSLLGKGESNFAGSTQARIQNIKIGAAIYNGTVIKPGEEFSFNGLLGPVDAAGGYKPELVLKDKKIMPEYGGGLCQVSTTIFRAATNAGLKITERHAHSLPMRYYSPQGFDATIYPGVSDFKFINDTSDNILIQSEIKGTTLTFEIFGVHDGRKVSLVGPGIYETGDGGAMKTLLTRTVTMADGTEKKDSFYSDYKSPALYPLVKNPLE